AICRGSVRNGAGFQEKTGGILSFQMHDPHYPIRIVSNSAPVSRFPRSVWAIALILAGNAGTAVGQESGAPGPARLAELPERFFQVQDEAGFLWQALDNGALLSGDTQYLQSGLNLIVDGEPFAPSAATASEPGSGGERIAVRLDETR